MLVSRYVHCIIPLRHANCNVLIALRTSPALALAKASMVVLHGTGNLLLPWSFGQKNMTWLLQRCDRLFRKKMNSERKARKHASWKTCEHEAQLITFIFSLNSPTLGALLYGYMALLAVSKEIALTKAGNSVVTSSIIYRLAENFCVSSSQRIVCIYTPGWRKAIIRRWQIIKFLKNWWCRIKNITLTRFDSDVAILVITFTMLVRATGLKLIKNKHQSVSS